MQSVDVIKYTDEEYEKHLTDNVSNQDSGVQFSVVSLPFIILIE